MGLILKRKSRFLPPISFSPSPINKVRRRIHIKKGNHVSFTNGEGKEERCYQFGLLRLMFNASGSFYIFISFIYLFFISSFFFYKVLDFELDGYFSHSIPFKFFRLENFVVIWLIRVSLWLRPRGWVLEKKKNT